LRSGSAQGGRLKLTQAPITACPRFFSLTDESPEYTSSGRSVSYYAREGAELLGDPPLAPTLILCPGNVEEVLAKAE
jgi:hypothetical protein